MHAHSTGSGKPHNFEKYLQASKSKDLSRIVKIAYGYLWPNEENVNNYSCTGKYRCVCLFSSDLVGWVVTNNICLQEVTMDNQVLQCISKSFQ